MCGKTRQDKIRNEAIRERVGVAPIVEKMVENRLRGRPKKTIREVIKKDLEINGLDRSMVLDRTLWRKLIHVADPT
ncbi:hypothetical protein JHK85_011310 [Glycine max]|nr:hypothetical protein JHK87_010867 [Glycine soja]KAG5050207.1 hypothetical protein JHK85_011310 [Glycine max]KAG5067266.1 hypothetical protein JHK86_010997 [Glycine max]